MIISTETERPHMEGRWARWWKLLRETANPHTMHTEDLSPAELQRQASFESFEYYKSYPNSYMEHLREQHHRRLDYHQRAQTEMAAGPSADDADGASVSDRRAQTSERIAQNFAQLQQLAVVQDEAERHVVLRWILYVLIAVSVGFVATFVAYAVEALESFRETALHRVILGPYFRVLGYVFGGVVWVVISAALAAVASGVVVYVEPAAAGGGIPDIMAYLNGVNMPHAMGLRTFGVKLVSCVFAVGSGLPVGLEAPLIHLGGITAAGVTQGRSRALGFQSSLFQAFRTNKDRRDFITAGAACGVSAAFGAPIGGLLFVMEEVSSVWDHSVSGQIFLATMICFTVTSMINSVVEQRRLLGWVSNTASVLFEVNLTILLNLIAIVPSVFLGLLLGCIAALFTKVNLILIRWRRRHLLPFPHRRFLEPVVLAAVFSAVMYVTTVLTECRTTKSRGTYNASVYVWGTEDLGRLFNETCWSNETYSPLGSLSMATGKNTIRHLFTRQTAGEFPPYYLLLYFVLYFTFACLSSGAAVSGGLVVPSLVIGAIFGRFYGLIMWYTGITNIGVERGYWTTEAWMDPGVFALIGAGAFLAGTSRMTMSICVIMVELSSELHYLLPVMVAIVMSKTVADWLCVPLYHVMLEMDCVPYLSAELQLPEFEQLTAADVMAARVVTLRVRERTDVILDVLRRTTHHAFPVVEVEPAGGGATHSKFAGLVTREDLQVYLTLPQLTRHGAEEHQRLEEAHRAGTLPADVARRCVPDGFGGVLAACAVRAGELTWAEWVSHRSGQYFAADRHSGWTSDAAADSSAPLSASLPPVVDLSFIVNRSPWCVPRFFNLQMAYQTFRLMGLRHMVVVDGDRVSGIITRKDLLVDALRQRTNELQDGLEDSTDQGGAARRRDSSPAAPAHPLRSERAGLYAVTVTTTVGEAGDEAHLVPRCVPEVRVAALEEEDDATVRTGASTSIDHLFD
ncbi:chloride channel protein [Strigomonas culicis]|uniref:Chloride channel protein n=1 Tax=Strigomonas culicis TaxID=28005 RepID=S9VEN4_9TRYP|nr:chloride channel protein [Strigomonas culicis]EPY25556.1 chloride channel protein [Strigomonas culicis]|eukprot:EPY22927.1 chloride channel protein [Strigomonas culicis]